MAKRERREYQRRTMLRGEEIRYAIDVDWDDVERMARKAARNKSGRSVAGPVVVYVHPSDRRA